MVKMEVMMMMQEKKRPAHADHQHCFSFIAQNFDDGGEHVYCLCETPEGRKYHQLYGCGDVGVNKTQMLTLESERHLLSVSFAVQPEMAVRDLKPLVTQMMRKEINEMCDLDKSWRQQAILFEMQQNEVVRKNIYLFVIVYVMYYFFVSHTFALI